MSAQAPSVCLLLAASLAAATLAKGPTVKAAHAETHNAETHNAETHNAETHNAETHNAETHNAETHNAETHNAETHNAQDAQLLIDCLKPTRPINPMIYGIAFDARLDAKDSYQWQLNPGARRWGGNTSTRYNWHLGNAWNTGSDWFFRNVNFSDDPHFTYQSFFAANAAHHAQTALTVPIIGWVAKDTESAGFPSSRFGKQRNADPYGHDAGDGVKPDGTLLGALDPSQTSVAAPPEFIGRWVAAIVASDQRRRGRSVHEYILDNEPDLWNSTHRDVHPGPVGYDELLSRTIAYASAIRSADPQAVIAGPASWGWPGYGYSAQDALLGFSLKPDRRAHDDKPLLAWYLQKLAEHEATHGVRLLDVLDVHFYPMADGVGGKNGGTDPATSAKRLRATRSLWDSSYVDESWINEPVNLLPRLQRLVDENYPGTSVSVGEWNFGAEKHMSGGLATAEALGQFGRAGVRSAFYWTYPPKNSPAAWAFSAFRNYDGKGGRFLDTALATSSPSGLSLFASRGTSGASIVAIVLNFSTDQAFDAHVDLKTCGRPTGVKSFKYTGEETGLVASTPKKTAGTTEIEVTVVPYSMNVFEISLIPTAREAR